MTRQNPVKGLCWACRMRGGEWCNRQHATLWMSKIWFESRLPSQHSPAEKPHRRRGLRPKRLRTYVRGSRMVHRANAALGRRRVPVLQRRTPQVGTSTGRRQPQNTQEIRRQVGHWHGTFRPRRRRCRAAAAPAHPADSDPRRGIHLSPRASQATAVRRRHQAAAVRAVQNLRIACPNCSATFDTHCGRKNRRERIKRTCLRCAAEFVPADRSQRYCSRDCGRRWDRRGRPRPQMRRVERPPYEHLVAQIAGTSYVAVGRRHGVSDNAIRKWVRQYERERTNE